LAQEAQPSSSAEWSQFGAVEAIKTAKTGPASVKAETEIETGAEDNDDESIKSVDLQQSDQESEAESMTMADPNPDRIAKLGDLEVPLIPV